MTQQRRSWMPWRYGLFLAILACAAPLALVWPWYQALLAAFDVAAITYCLTLVPLFQKDAAAMRVQSARNDPDAALLLLLTAIVTAVVLVAVATELTPKEDRTLASILFCIATLGAAWVFSNLVYTLHYAHLYYAKGSGGKDRGGLDFPGTKEPDYGDFLYFAFTLGMAFATSDVAVTDRKLRPIVTFHALAAFVFNLGVLASSVNILAGL